jgi:peroxiredoxin
MRTLPLLLLLTFPATLFSGAAGPVRNLQEMKKPDPAPAFSLSGLDGKRVSISDFRGKVVFLNFWASWCAPCREEFPGMERLYRDLKGEDFVILGVNVKETREKAVQFVKELKITFPIVLDPEGDVGLLYGAWGLPTTYVIDKKGRAVARVFGPAAWDGRESYEYFRSLLRRPS